MAKLLSSGLVCVTRAVVIVVAITSLTALIIPILAISIRKCTSYEILMFTAGTQQDVHADKLGGHGGDQRAKHDQGIARPRQTGVVGLQVPGLRFRACFGITVGASICRIGF